MISLPILEREIAELWKFRLEDDSEIKIRYEINTDDYLISSSGEFIRAMPPRGNNLDDYSDRVLLPTLRELKNKVDKRPAA
jgi:hypothetical protein